MQIIKGKLIGYRKKQVDAYLENIYKLNEAEIASIIENIETCKLKNAYLLQNLRVLQEKKASQAQAQTLLELALQRTKNIVALLDTAAQEEISEVSRNSRQKLAVYENNLVEIERKIIKTRQQTETMLQTILQYLKEKEEPKEIEENQATKKVVGTILPSASKSESIRLAIGEDMVGKMVVSTNGAPVGEVGKLVINQSTKEIEGFYLKEGPQSDRSFIYADCVIAVKNDSLVVATEWQTTAPGKTMDMKKTGISQPENLQSPPIKQIAANGTDLPPQNTSGKKLESTGESSPAANTQGSVNPEAQIIEKTNTKDNTQGDFWGGLDAIPEPELPTPEKAATEKVLSQAKQGKIPELMLTNAETAPAAEPTPAPKTPNDSAQEKSSTTLEKETAPNAHAKITKQKASPAVAQEINSVRHKYVVGKLAGEDLLDNSGEVIIHKNELITPEIMESAEQEGKLAELIVNMVIPGLEE